jgi:phosphatidylinositol alpha-1,6-mannosyltransferase
MRYWEDAIRWRGTCSDAEFADAYAGADMHVFPGRDMPGDVESFGMVAVEAAAHGLPTVAFATGGVVDAVAENESGYLITPDDYPAFANAVLEIMAQRDSLRASCLAFSRRFAWPAFGAGIVAQLSCTYI